MARKGHWDHFCLNMFAPMVLHELHGSYGVSIRFAGSVVMACSAENEYADSRQLFLVEVKNKDGQLSSI